MTEIRAPSNPKGEPILSTLVGCSLGLGIGYALFYLTWPIGLPWVLTSFGDFGEHQKYLIDGFNAYFLMSDGSQYNKFLSVVKAQNELPSFYVHLLFPILVSILVCIVATAKLYAKTVLRDIHLRGLTYFSEVIESLRLAKGENLKEYKIDKRPGVKIHPQIRVNLTRENQGFLVSGGMGSGKSQIIWPIILDVIKLNEKVHNLVSRIIIYDDKSEFTQLIPVEDSEILILAPWDERSIVWDIAKDVTTKGDARDIAALLIKDSSDPMWSEGARQILTGVFAAIIDKRGENWGFKELTDVIGLGAKDLSDFIGKYAIESARTLEALRDPENQTGKGIMITLDSFMSVLFDLRLAWPNYEKARESGKAFSIQRFLSEDYDGAKILIYQGSERYKEMRKSLSMAFFTRFIAYISDASFPEVRQRQSGVDYRLYFFFDEFPQMGKVSSIERLISVCRSKGVRVLLGYQDIGQIIEVYSKETAGSWFSQLTTKFICNVSPGDTAKWIAESFDKKEYQRQTVSGSWSPKEEHPNVSIGYDQREHAVIYPSQLTTDLGADPSGVRAILACSKWSGLYRLEWPITKLKKKREGVIPAMWTKSILPVDEDEHSESECDSGDEDYSDPFA